MLGHVVVFLGVLVAVRGFESVLAKQSVLYGVARVANGGDFNGSECCEDFRVLWGAVNSKRVWALKALDASGQPDSGFLLGNNMWIGSHSQCSDISNTKPLEINHENIPHAPATPHDFPPYDMRFIAALLRHNSTLQQHTQMPLEYNIQLGLCVPSSCTTDELSRLIQVYLDSRELFVQDFYNLDVQVEKVRALREDSVWLFLEPASLALLSVVGVILLLCVVGTILDVREHRQMPNMVQGFNSMQKGATKNVSELGLVMASEETFSMEPNTLEQIVRCFSLRSNIRVLVNAKVSSESVAAVHGLRLFGMFWVIMVHAVFYEADYLKNVPYAYRLSESLPNQILSNSTYCVDTYLCLSGFLVGYMFYKSKTAIMNTTNRTNYLSKLTEYLTMFTNRFLRLTPTYLIIVGFANMFFTYYRQTASLYSSEQLEESCSKYWWRNVLYINNLFPRSEMCLSWSWYLSLDTQCFAVSTLLLILSTICFKTAVTAMVAILLGCIAATGYRSYTIGYIPTMDEQLKRLDDIYDLPWNRMGPYLVGVMTGYVLVVKLDQKLVLRRKTLVVLWTVFPLLNLWILFTLYRRNIGVEFSAFYMATSRTLWGVGLGWLLIACYTNNGGIVQRFLSFSGWVPFSRLTYCAYLLNPLVANMLYLGSENVFTVSTMSFTMAVSSVTFWTFFYAFWASLFFEAPFIKLNKLLVSNMIRKKENADNTA